MRRILLFLLAAVVACVASAAAVASAEVREFGKEFRYTVDVPKDWIVEQDGDSKVTFTAPDNSASLVVLVERNQGAKPSDLEGIARDVSEQTGLAKIVKNRDGSYLLSGEIKGVECNQYLVLDDEMFASYLIAGDQKAAGAVYGTLTFKK